MKPKSPNASEVTVEARRDAWKNGRSFSPKPPKNIDGKILLSLNSHAYFLLCRMAEALDCSRSEFARRLFANLVGPFTDALDNQEPVAHIEFDFPTTKEGWRGWESRLMRGRLQ